MENFIDGLWTFANSPVGLTIIGAVAAWILGQIYLKKPQWKKYEGTIIAAIKFAERSIPDSHHNKSVARLDKALKYVLEHINRKPTNKLETDLKEGIQIIKEKIDVTPFFEVADPEQEDGEK